LRSWWEGLGPADVVALGVIDSQPAKLSQGGFILNAFRDRLDLELLCDADDRPDDLLVVLVVA
jgi:hypothetical protein